MFTQATIYLKAEVESYWKLDHFQQKHLVHYSVRHLKDTFSTKSPYCWEGNNFETFSNECMYHFE